MADFFESGNNGLGGNTGFGNGGFGNTGQFNNGSNSQTFDWSNFILGDGETPSALGVGANVLQGIMGAYTGWQGLNLAKDQFNLANAATRANYTNQAKAFNLNLSDRYVLMQDRANTNSSVAQQGIMSRDEFMNKYSVKEEL